jgi:hypothetical protein
MVGVSGAVRGTVAAGDYCTVMVGATDFYYLQHTDGEQQACRVACSEYLLCKCA